MKQLKNSEPMKIYLMTKRGSLNYHEYDACVVCAESVEDAKEIHPDGGPVDSKLGAITWVTDKKYIEVKEIGTPNLDQKRGVILASFNAG